jgi:hypothetical protein
VPWRRNLHLRTSRPSLSPEESEGVRSVTLMVQLQCLGTGTGCDAPFRPEALTDCKSTGLSKAIRLRLKRFIMLQICHTQHRMRSI